MATVPNLVVSVDATNGDETAPDEVCITYDDPDIKDAAEDESDGQQSDVKITLRVKELKQTSPEKRYINPNSISVGKEDITISEEKLRKRQEKFQTGQEETTVVSSANLNQATKDLYAEFDIDPTEQSSTVHHRLNVVHLRGVEEMSTADIFEYFAEYAAQEVEWITDFTCNVVWSDREAAARAIIGMSKQARIIHRRNSQAEDSSAEKAEYVSPLKKAEREDSVSPAEKMLAALLAGEEPPPIDLSSEEEDEAEPIPETSGETLEDCVTLDAREHTIPPGVWRVGRAHAKSQLLLFRFATRDDVKEPGAQGRSMYYQKHGNPNYGNMPGLISRSRKRKMLSARNQDDAFSRGESGSDSNSRWQHEDREGGTGSDPEEIWDLRDRIKSKQLDRTQAAQEISDYSSDSDEGSGLDDVMPKARKMRMRMRADDEQVKREKKERARKLNESYPPMTISVDVVDSRPNHPRQRANIRTRLGGDFSTVDLRERLGSSDTIGSNRPRNFSKLKKRRRSSKDEDYTSLLLRHKNAAAETLDDADMIEVCTSSDGSDL